MIVTPLKGTLAHELVDNLDHCCCECGARHLQSGLLSRADYSGKAPFEQWRELGVSLQLPPQPFDETA